MENKFRPSEAQIETAKGIAKKNDKSTVWVNDKGEFFLQEDFCRTSVGGDKDKYARLDFTTEGEVKEGHMRKLTEEDLKQNPILKSQGLKVGDEIQVLDPEEEEEADNILDGKADEVIAAVAKSEDPENLKLLFEQEKSGKNRSTVLKAIEGRIEELEDAGDGDE